jgi:predicted ArsR family transcriptional regulator
VRQIDRVFAAVKSGSRTSPEVASMTGLPLKHASHYLRDLAAKGKLKHTGFSGSGRGRRAKFYELPGK